MSVVKPQMSAKWANSFLVNLLLRMGLGEFFA